MQVKVGDEIDVYFDASEGEDGGIVLSRQRRSSSRSGRTSSRHSTKNAASKAISSAR